MENYEALRTDLRHASPRIKWAQAQGAQAALDGSLGLVEEALRKGAVNDVLVKAAMATVLCALQQERMELSVDLWDRGREERDKSYRMWSVALRQDLTGMSRAAEALESGRVQLEGSVAERDLLNTFEAHGRLMSVLGAVAVAVDFYGTFAGLLEEARQTVRWGVAGT